MRRSRNAAAALTLLLAACNRTQTADVQPSPSPAPAALEAATSEEPWVGQCGSLRILRVTGHVTPPVLVREVAPVYPPAVQRIPIEGIVLAELIVDAAGKVCDARIVSGVFPEIDDPVLDAVRQWEFRPATLDGQAVAVSYVVPVTLDVKPDV